MRKNSQTQTKRYFSLEFRTEETSLFI